MEPTLMIIVFAVLRLPNWAARWVQVGFNLLAYRRERDRYRAEHRSRTGVQPRSSEAHPGIQRGTSRSEPRDGAVPNAGDGHEDMER